jgi:hypothetical protein
MLANYIGEKLSIEALITLSKVNIDATKSENDAGFKMVEKLITADELQSFVKMWRQHFLDIMDPQHMPNFWSVDRPLIRE